MTVVRDTNQLFSTIEGQVVIISIENDNYIGLEGTGNRIWELIENPVRIGEICTLLMTEYMVSAEQCETEVMHFLEKLAENGLVKISLPETAG